MAPFDRLAARKIALQVYSRLQGESDTIESAMDGSADALGRLKPSERAWVYDLVASAQRWQGVLEQAIEAAATRKAPTGRLRRILTLAAAQVIAQTRGGGGKAVSEWVDFVRAMDGEPPARFANALLRRITEQAQDWRTFPERIRETDETPWRGLALGQALYERLKAAYGFEWVSRFAQQSLARPEIWLRIAPDLEQRLPATLQAGSVAGSARYVEAEASPSEWPEIRSGKAIVQGLSSQRLVAEAYQLVSTVLGKKSPRVLDRCAAPGGKAVSLAWWGADVVASDERTESVRWSLLESAVERTQAFKLSDPKLLPELVRSEPFDWIWVDAPCTGSGTLRKHPELRTLDPKSRLQSLLKTQAALCRETLPWVPVGGYWLYSVCSVLPEEGAAAFKELPPGFEEAKRWWMDPAEAATVENSATSVDDGFWAILLRRIE